MVNEVINAIVGLGILGSAYLIDLMIGIVKVNFGDIKWSWKKWFSDLMKMVVMGLGIVGWVAILHGLKWYMSNNGADMSILGDVSYVGMIGGIIGGSVWYMINSGRNIISFLNKKKVEVEIDESKMRNEIVAKRIQEIGKDIIGRIFEPREVEVEEDYVELKVDSEKVKSGGVGQVYKVPVDSYDSFKRNVIGRGFDIDNFYDWQCWDGAALLWQQFGRSLITGNGLAIGCWDLKREVNRYDLFDLVYNVNLLKAGDVVCMRPNHIGFFDSWNGQYMVILGQNQGGSPKKGNTQGFNLVNIHRNAFAGAFRLKKWNVVVNNPEVAKKSNEEIANEVIRGLWGNGIDRKNRLEGNGYDYGIIQGIVDMKLGGGVNHPQVRKYTVVQGDSLWEIAVKFYGDGRKYHLIYDGNKKVIGDNPALIKPGMVLEIP